MADFFKNLFYDGRITEYIALLGSLIAIVISVCSYQLSKRNLILNSITANRIKWIYDVRDSMLDFLKEYLKKEKCSEYELEIARAKIELFLMRSSSNYKDFTNQLIECTKNPFTEDNYNGFIIEAQKVLSTTWRRMKLEAGIKGSYDIKITNILLKDRIKKDEYNLLN